MKTLCLLTNEFPYGSWEPYLETEIKYYSHFERVIIFSLQLRKSHSETIRKMPDNVEIVPIYYASRLTYFFYSVFVLFDVNFYRELFVICKSKKYLFSRFISMLVFLSRSHYECNKILKHVNRKELDDSVLYSYRFEYQPYVAYLVKKKLHLKSKIVSRAHRYDLYEYMRPNIYIPLRRLLLNELDKVYPCSCDGTKYLKEKFPEYVDKISTRYLGTIDFGVAEYSNRKSTFNIVSCSNVVPVKRLELLITALSKIRDYNVSWTHYGDGPLLKKMETMAKKMLPSNVSYMFKGSVSNSDLMNLYKNGGYHLFVNVSSSEGIPVSIMEANSFGIPCVATDVGGTSELIKSGVNGILLKKDASPIDVTNAILTFEGMDDNEYESYRCESRNIWNNHFNANRNYSMFIDELNKQF